MRIGIDLISVKKFRKIKEEDFPKWSKVFNKEEWSHAFQGLKSAERLAGIFAAKEAAMKASGIVGPAYFLKWRVRHKKSGAPFLRPKGLLSISHDSNMAIAVAIL